MSFHVSCQSTTTFWLKVRLAGRSTTLGPGLVLLLILKWGALSPTLHLISECDKNKSCANICCKPTGQFTYVGDAELQILCYLKGGIPDQRKKESRNATIIEVTELVGEIFRPANNRKRTWIRTILTKEVPCEDVPMLLTPSWCNIPLIIIRSLGDVGQCGGKEFKRTPGEGSSGPSPWLREKVRSKVGRFPGFGLFSEARASMGRPPTERRPIREYGRKPNILLSPGWDNMSSSSSLSMECHQNSISSYHGPCYKTFWCWPWLGGQHKMGCLDTCVLS